MQNTDREAYLKKERQVYQFTDKHGVTHCKKGKLTPLRGDTKEEEEFQKAWDEVNMQDLNLWDRLKIILRCWHK